MFHSSSSLTFCCADSYATRVLRMIIIYIKNSTCPLLPVHKVAKNDIVRGTKYLDVHHCGTVCLENDSGHPKSDSQPVVRLTMGHVVSNLKFKSKIYLFHLLMKAHIVSVATLSKYTHITSDPITPQNTS